MFYRRHQVYSIAGKLPDLGDFLIAGCRYGGPIGMFATPPRGLMSDVGSIHCSLDARHYENDSSRSGYTCILEGPNTRILSCRRRTAPPQCGYLIMCFIEHSELILMFDCSGIKERSSSLGGHWTNGSRSSTRKAHTDCTIFKATTSNTLWAATPVRWGLLMRGFTRAVWWL